jgi:hypothetical protein
LDETAGQSEVRDLGDLRASSGPPIDLRGLDVAILSLEGAGATERLAG